MTAARPGDGVGAACVDDAWAEPVNQSEAETVAAFFAAGGSAASGSCTSKRESVGELAGLRETRG